MITRMLQGLTEREPIDPELQRHLSESGYYGRTAKCLRWKLVGVQRPGWVQVFEFHIRAKRTTGDWEEKFGMCRIDERYDTYEIQLFDDENARREACLLSTSEMITAERGTDHWVKTMLMTLFVVALSIATIGAVVNLGTAEKPSEVNEPE
jgi:hypothetical protein